MDKPLIDKAIVSNKILTIEKCITRINQEFISDEAFRANITQQDSVILNLQRACEACIDIGNHLIRVNKFSAPQSARDTFEILYASKVISQECAKKMQNMVGLRNIAVHDYQSLNLDIVIKVIQTHLSDFTDFIRQILSE